MPWKSSAVRSFRHIHAVAALAIVLAMPFCALARPTLAQPLDLAELEAAGARIGEVRVITGDIFDTSDPEEDKLPFRVANALHIRTQAAVIEAALLFKKGDALSLNLIEETERLLRSNRYLYDVQIAAVSWHDGVVDIEVRTRDTWSLDPGFSASRAGGANSTGIRLKEYNLLGTGMALSIGRSRTVDRSSNELMFSSERAFGTWTALNYSVANNSDGRRDAVSLVRPFYALDARWAAGLSAARDDRIDAVYNAGNIVSEFRHQQQHAEAFVGWSPGRQKTWVQRWTTGIGWLDERYAPEPDRVAPAQLPDNDRLVTPFVRCELIEDRFEKLKNHNSMARPEFFAMGLAATAQLGWASTSWGSQRNALVYSGSLSRGFELGGRQNLLTSASISGQYAAGQIQRLQLGARAQYYLPHDGRWLFYASASADSLSRPMATETLLLGGDNGLRGYPLRYQNGQRRALLTVEERVFSDAFVWRLWRVGGAAFLDTGRAWGGDALNTVNPGWLSNVGVGLRIVNVRAAFSSVLHIDLAFPLNATSDIKQLQLLVKTKASF